MTRSVSRLSSPVLNDIVQAGVKVNIRSRSLLLNVTSPTTTRPRTPQHYFHMETLGSLVRRRTFFEGSPAVTVAEFRVIATLVKLFTQLPEFLPQDSSSLTLAPTTVMNNFIAFRAHGPCVALRWGNPPTQVSYEGRTCITFVGCSGTMLASSLFVLRTVPEKESPVAAFLRDL